MSNIKRSGLVLIAVCAFGAVAVSSASASPLFLSHPTGLLLASAGSTAAKFKAAPGIFECTTLNLLQPGDVTVALRALSILATVDYKGCTAFGLAVTLHPARYLIDANGLISLTNTILALGNTGCVITFPAGPNQSLSKINFDNNAVNKGLLMLAAVKGITSSGVGGPGGLCLYAEENKGEFIATFHVTVHGGTIRWDA